MVETLGLQAEQQAFNEVGVALYRLLEEGDDRIEYRASMTAAVQSARILAYNPAGRYETSEGRANSPRESDELSDALGRLREASYRPGAGTWFSVRIVVTSDGAATAEYNYDKEPDFGLGGIDPIAYVTDQEKFPRDETKQPEWLKERLAEGRARISGQG